MAAPPGTSPSWIRRTLLLCLLGVLLGICYLVLRPFAKPLAWTAILAYVTWPLHRQVRAVLGGRRRAAALVTTAAVTSLLVVPTIGAASLLHAELTAAYRVLAQVFDGQDSRPLLDFAARMPFVGDQLQRWLSSHVQDPAWLPAQLAALAQRWSSELLTLAGGIARTSAQLLLMLVILFFVYRDGELAVAQMRQLASRYLSDTMDPYVRSAGSMVRVVVFGSLVTALAQGAVAGAGYWTFSVGSPVLLAVLTALVALVPIFGTSLVYVPLCAGLVLSGDLWSGLGVLIWCLVLVHPIDNIMRPLLISSSAKIPFLFAMLGALGGLSAFGLIGLFIGPVSLALLMAVWDTWVADAAAASGGHPRPPDRFEELQDDQRQKAGAGAQEHIIRMQRTEAEQVFGAGPDKHDRG